MSRKQLIIVITFVTIFIILGIIGIISAFTNNSSQSSSSGGQEVTVDPVSGESITPDTNLHQDNYLPETEDRPVIFGISKLTDYGLTFEQENKVYDALYSFSAKQSPKIKRISFYKDSYSWKSSDDQGISHMYFKMQASETTDYFLDVAYSGIADVTVTIYASDNKTVLFTQR